MPRDELDILRGLLKLTSMLSISPNYKSTKNGKKSSRLYGILIASVILISYGISIDGTIKQQYIKNHYSRMEILLDSMTTLLVTVSAIITVLSPVFYYHTWTEFFKLLRNLIKTTDNSILNDNITAMRVNIEVFFINAVFGIRFVWSILVWERCIGIETSKYRIFSHAIEYIPLISITLMIYLNRIIKHKYKQLNKSAQQLSTWMGWRNITSQTNKFSVLTIYTANDFKNRIKIIHEKYRKLGRIVFYYNCIFGWQILFILGITIMAMLDGLNFILKQNNVFLLSWNGVGTLLSLVSLIILFKIANLAFINYRCYLWSMRIHYYELTSNH